MVKITEKNMEEVMKKKFRIVQNKGFHIKFLNGWTISVQFGWGNYCDNYNNPPEELKDFGKVAYASDTAEIWSWNENGKNYPKEPIGYQTPEQVLKFINKVSKFKSIKQTGGEK